MAIRWLIDAYDSLKASRQTLVVVPINISLDRIYESANLATEMINGEKEDYTMLTAFSKMRNSTVDQIGDVYVKYLEPVFLNEWLQKNAPQTKRVPHKSFENTALQLTKHLLEK